MAVLPASSKCSHTICMLRLFVSRRLALERDLLFFRKLLVILNGTVKITAAKTQKRRRGNILLSLYSCLGALVTMRKSVRWRYFK